MTRLTCGEQNNPVAERAAARRAEWEAQASQKTAWWQVKRFDVLDLILLVIGITGTLMLVLMLI